MKLPHVKVKSVDEYFELPKKDREKFGLYLNPIALPWEKFDSRERGWDYFDHKIKKEYPIQYFFREKIFDNPVYWFFRLRYLKIKDGYWAIKRFFDPIYPRFHKSHRKHQYKELDTALVATNFALILDFYYGQVWPETFVEWFYREEIGAVRQWLDETVYWIEEVLPEIKKFEIEAYKTVDKTLPYEEAYKDVNWCEKTILDKETEILTKLVEFRGYLWT